ncbi:unnamed protein product [Porites lobata]|uniref:Uncharacterized protein n=1 Tax=Porites lobata TaxID=104759 RepID=A0ABN8QHN6_9CNID|nr:unnamed protein product [Porites lobata]
MKTFVFLSLCVTLPLGCSNLPKFESCNKPEGVCSCQAGLVCTVTKQILKMGEVMLVRQCMPEGEKIEVETLDLEEEEDTPMRNKRWLWFNRCKADSDCKKNFCCAFGKRCAPKLFKYFTCNLEACADLSKFKVCNRPDGDDYSCQAGLSCVQTKLFIMKGQKAYVKQCVPEGMKIDVETVNKDHDQASRNSRLLPGLPQLPGQSCRSEGDCQQNQCCARFVNRCLPKLPEMAECSLKILHNCGCQDGLKCQKTGEVTIPIIGIKVPLLQCVSSLPGGDIS